MKFSYYYFDLFIIISTMENQPEYLSYLSRKAYVLADIMKKRKKDKAGI